jgi:hypothetical protein
VDRRDQQKGVSWTGVSWTDEEFQEFRGQTGRSLCGNRLDRVSREFRGQELGETRGDRDSGGQTKSTPMKGERGVLHVPLLAIERQFTLSRISSRISRAPSLPQYQTAMCFLLQFPDEFRRS